MGSNQSSYAKDGVKSTSGKKSSGSLGVRGRKSMMNNTKRGSAPHGLTASIVSIPSEHLHELHRSAAGEELDDTAALSVHSDDIHLHAEVELEDAIAEDTESESDDDDEDDEDEEDDEFLEERLRVLEEARKLKQVAEYFLHPEAPVASSPGTRCFFDRFSAPRVVEQEEADEMASILADAMALKTLASGYLHPEKPVETTDPTSYGRNYFSRPSAVEQESLEDMESRDAVMADIRACKSNAVAFLHPEVPVTGSGACARNYYSRPSAPIFDEEDERAQILREAAALKMSATDFLHPEVPVVTTDPTSFGRNYFNRPSAPEIDVEERNQIMKDLQDLKRAAVDYLHPEMPVVADGTAFGRNYFNRPSGPAPESFDDSGTRSMILNDLHQLKEAAAAYLHPEKPVVTTDPTATGRNYFTRFGAPECLPDRDRILADAAALKESAGMFLHPEVPVTATDGTAFGRNYFTRYGATESDMDYEIRNQVLEDAAAFKQLSMNYLHPELPLVIYASSTGRNYFSRISGPEYGSLEDSEERHQVMEDIKAFKQLAADYLHPEAPVMTLDGNAFARNYFNRASAPVQESKEDVQDREAVLADSAALKQSATDFLHPELPVIVYATAAGRNFFSHPSGLEQESPEEVEERDRIMEDIRALKQLASDYMHPEKPVVTTDGTAFGRNYFLRPSAPLQELEAEVNERAAIFADIKGLKQSAVDHLHPEIPVVTTDPLACASNYFSRTSVIMDDPDEYNLIMADMKALKKSAVDFLHPEVPVVTTDATACARNYFGRYSSPMYETPEEVEERAQALADASALKKTAADYLHPERPVVGAEASTRNYFSRPSSTLHNQMIHTFPVHDDDWTEHEHIDHFGMDEEVNLFADLRKGLGAPIENNRSKVYSGYADSDVGSNLSRSPSSVMLFGMDDSINYD